MLIQYTPFYEWIGTVTLGIADVKRCIDEIYICKEYIYLMECKEYIFNGMILRYIITIFSFYILFLFRNDETINKYIYLILAILLVILDGVDSIFTFLYKKNTCHQTFYYQYLDKICDSVSYLLLFLFFKLDNILLYLVLYRIIGVILFSLIKNSIYLMLFFDFVKEYLLYIFVFKNNYTYLPIIVICKIAYEIYFHSVINKLHY